MLFTECMINYALFLVKHRVCQSFLGLMICSNKHIVKYCDEIIIMTLNVIIFPSSRL